MKRTLEVATRSSKQGSAECAVCSVLKRAENSAVSLFLKREIKELLAKHIAFTNAECQTYMSHGFEAMDNPRVSIVLEITHICIYERTYLTCMNCVQVLSVAMDGADQSAHDLPKVVGRVPKDLQPWPQKLQCVLLHGSVLCMFNVLNVVHAGANMAMTCLMRALQIMEDDIPEVLYLQVDGGSENWNQVLFGLIDLLFDLYGKLKKVIVSRLPVGHTHIDVDRFFSYLNKKLFGTSAGGRKDGANVFTREEFSDIFFQSMASNKDTMLLQHRLEDLNGSYDFWSWLSPHFYNGFSGYGSSGNVHVLKYERIGNAGPPHISYKFWHQSPKWLPEDGSSLKVLSSRPDLSDLKTLEVSPLVENHMDVLVGLQKPLLKWLAAQRQVGLVSPEVVQSWKNYFKTLGESSSVPSICVLSMCAHI